MIETQTLAEALTANFELLKRTLADFSDQDMLARPTPGANHAAWQLGHTAVSEANMVNGVQPGKGAAIPEGWATKFNKDAAGSDDPAAFPSKSQLLEFFGRARAAAIELVKTVTPEELKSPAPERIRFMAPTVGHLLLLIPAHTAMHVGQMQVVRRKLGKPVLM